MANQVKRGIWWLFLKIEEPRLVRVFQFVVYSALALSGFFFVFAAPQPYTGVLGPILVGIFSTLVLLGGLAGAFAVLPGLWWVERLAIISLITGLSIFNVVALSIGSTLATVGLSWALVATLGIRWLEIKDFQLAPGR